MQLRPFISNRLNKYFLSALLAMLLLAPLLNNIKRLFNNCLHAVDFSIYQQAIYKIAQGDFNPYLTVRGVNIFNDHFDPIIILAAPFIYLTNFNPITPLVFEWFWFFAMVVFLILTRRGCSNFFYAALMIILCKGILAAIDGPIHAGTWSIFPIFVLSYYMYQKKFIPVFLCAVILCLYKEMFPFCLVSLSLHFFLNREMKKGLLLVFTGALLIILVFFLRPYYLGNIVGYGGDLMAAVVKNPIEAFFRAISSFYVLNFIKFYSPFVLPIIFLIWKGKSNLKKILTTSAVGIIFYFLPIVMIFFYYGMLASFHYAAPICAGILGVIIFNPNFQKIPRKALAVSMILFVASAFSYYRDIVKSLFLNIGFRCTYTKSKHVNMNDLRSKLKDVSPDDAIISTGGIIPQILTPEMNIYIPKCFTSRRKTNNFDYLLFEINKSGDTYPLKTAVVHNIVEKCKSYASDIILENEDFVFMKGKFTRKCLGQEM